MITKISRLMIATGLALLCLTAAASAQDKPNIVVIWGDDIGVHNISAYNHGIMGYETPNIDRYPFRVLSMTSLSRSMATPCRRGAVSTPPASTTIRSKLWR